jgi:hypothetical protein
MLSSLCTSCLQVFLAKLKECYNGKVNLIPSVAEGPDKKLGVLMIVRAGPPPAEVST